MGHSPTTPPRFTITGMVPIARALAHPVTSGYNQPMAYNHTQPGRWHYLLFALTLATLAGACLARSELPVVITLLGAATILAFCGLMLGSLTISDEGEYLALRFGPLPVLRERFRYADITGVEIGRTKIIDGWGIHYVFFRGWTYNLWGFACVKLTLGQKIIRVGTDDADELAKVIREKTGLSRLSG